MSSSEGFGQGCGCVFGVIAALVLAYFLFFAAGKVVAPCQTCRGTGNCVVCSGSGKGVIWGSCMSCGGNKGCPQCGGVGWKAR